MLGVCGVELFFVLSGFLIGGILLRTVEAKDGFTFPDLQEFLRRRWYRTIPNYYLFLIVYTIFLVANNHHLPPIGWLVRYLLFLENFAWPNPSWIFGHSWSLCVEEWFYLLTAVILFLAVKVFSPSRRGRAWALAVTFGIILIVPTALRFAFRHQYEDLRMVVVFRLDSIVYGVLIALVRTRLPGLWNRPTTLLALGAVTTVVAIVMYGGSASSTATALTLMPAGFALLIPAFYRVTLPANFLRQWIGNISIWSYSIYMCHSLIYIGLAQLIGYNTLNWTGKLLYKVCALVLIVCVSALNYRFFEKKMTDLRDHHLVPQPPPAAALQDGRPRQSTS